MQINAIRLRNFRRLDSIDFEPGFLNVIQAPNGCGKTTLGHAIGWAVSGHCPWTQDNGYGMADLVREGAQECSVSLDLVTRTGEVSVSRSYPPHSLALTGAAGAGIRETQAALDMAIGCSGERARLALDPDRWFGLDQKRRQGILTEILGLHLDAQRVRALLQEHEESCKLPLVETAEALLEGPVTDNFARQEALFKNRVTALNRDLKTEKAALQAEEQRLQGLMAQHGTSAPEDAKKSLQALRNEAQEVRGMLARCEAWQEGLERLQARRDEAQTAMDDTAFPEGPTLDQLREALNKANTRIQERQAELVQARGAQGSRQAARDRIQALRERIASLEADLQKGACPTCGQGMPQETRQKLDEERRALFGEAQGLLPQAKAEDPATLIADLQARVEKGKAFRRDLETQIITAQDRERKGGVQAAIKRVEDADRDLQAHLSSPRQEPETLREWIAGLESKEVDLLAALSGPAEVERCRGQVEARKQGLARMERDLKLAQELRAWFGPSGIQRRHLEAGIQPVEANVNAILARWGMAVRYEYPTLDLTVQTPGSAGQFVPVANVSHSEWIRVGMAHQVYLAHQTGIGIVVVDNVESMDAEAQASLFAACGDLRDQLDHIILLAVQMTAPIPEDVTVLNLA